MNLLVPPTRGSSARTPDVLARELERVGDTLLVTVDLQLRRVGRRPVQLKLEGTNPGGSIKVRTALSIVDHLTETGLVGPGSRLVESSSGNLGVALAMIARARGLAVTVVVDPKISPENLAKLEALGASVELVTRRDKTGGYLLTRLELVQDLCRRDHGAIWTNQYSARANPRAHFLGTGPELLAAFQGRLDAVAVAVSTGGTLAGVGRFLRRYSPTTRIIAVDASGSVVFGGPPGPRYLNGIGASRQPSFDLRGLYDAVEIVDDATAFSTCRLLDEATGVRIGGSSGAALAGLARQLDENAALERVACICPDGGDNYRSTIWDDDWLSRVGVTRLAAVSPIRSFSAHEAPTLELSA